MYVCMAIKFYKQEKDQPGKIANSACGHLNREKLIFPFSRWCLRIWSRETGSAFPSRVSLLISILRLNINIQMFVHTTCLQNVELLYQAFYLKSQRIIYLVVFFWHVYVAILVPFSLSFLKKNLNASKPSN